MMLNASQAPTCNRITGMRHQTRARSTLPYLIGVVGAADETEQLGHGVRGGHGHLALLGACGE